MKCIWPVKKLYELTDIRVSNVDKKFHSGEKPIKLCNYMDVYSNDYITNKIQFMEASASPDEIDKFRLKYGDVVITKDSETPDDIGIPTVISEEMDNLICGYHLAIIRPNKNQINSIYLAKQLSASRVARYFAVKSSGSTRFGLSKSTIQMVEITVPPIPEQILIAEILSTADQAIEQTEALIAKLQRIKTGLMQDLLTKGIDENGNIRSEETHKFKDSPLGRIPVEWEVVKLGDIGRILRGASPRPKGDPRFYGGDIPRLMVEDVTRDGKWVTPKVDFLTEEGAKRSRLMPTGTLTIVCSSSVGVPSFLAVDACIHDGFLGFGYIIDNCIPEFLYYIFIHELDQFYSSATHGGVFTNLTIDIVKKFEIILPNHYEQQRIVGILRYFDESLEKEKSVLNKYQKLKTGLMQDLLTGKVRVTELLKKRQEEVS